MIRNMIVRCLQFLAPPSTVPVASPVAAAAAPAPPVQEAVTLPYIPPATPAAATPVAEPRKVQCRPPSEAMRKTMNLLARKPEITAGDLAKATGVSRDYARTLLRRAKVKEPVPAVQQPAAPQPDQVAFAETLEELRDAVKDIQGKLAVRKTPVPAAAAKEEINRRERIIQLLASGKQPREIASALKIPPGEVKFVSSIRKLAVHHA